MIPLSAEAERQLDRLLDHYARLNRFDASRALLNAIDLAVTQIQDGHASALSHPRPYPALSDRGYLWTKSGRYWIAYSTRPYQIIAIFYDTANIPGRLPDSI